MIRILVLMVLSSPLLMQAQRLNSFQQSKDDRGIKWTEGLSWNSVKEKAARDNKYIFIDVYATWCVPCKAMDKEVYSHEKVGQSLNEKFISIKVQMDTSKNDDSIIKSWYADANAIKKKYPIAGYPAFLFISPDGHLVHSALGYKNVNEFIDLVNYAMDPKKQFHTLIEDYRNGKKNYALFPYMISAAQQLNETDWEQKLARDYISNFLYHKPEKELFKKDYLTIIGEHLRTSNEKGFILFFKNQSRINELLGKQTYAQSRIDRVIYNEFVKSEFDRADKDNKDPNWKIIGEKIFRKYGSKISHRVILSAQLKWYNYKKDWPLLAKYNTEKIERYGLDTVGIAKSVTNNMIWKVFFLHCNDSLYLSKAVKWMEVVVKSDPYDAVNIDTYANLLYKTGRVSEAIKMETIALKLESDNKDIETALEDMKKLKPTYVKQGAIWIESTLSFLKATKSNYQ